MPPVAMKFRQAKIRLPSEAKLTAWFKPRETTPAGISGAAANISQMDIPLIRIE